MQSSGHDMVRLSWEQLGLSAGGQLKFGPLTLPLWRGGEAHKAVQGLATSNLRAPSSKIHGRSQFLESQTFSLVV